VALLAAVTLWSMMGMWAFSWWENHDAINTPIRLVAFTHEIHGGHLWVRWASMLNGGHGSPLFIFYAPGLMYFSLPFHLVGIPLLDCLKLATLALRLIGVMSLFTLAARRFGPMGGLTAGLAFALAPYLNALVFVRGALSEHAAVCLIPPLLLCLDATLSRRRLAPLFAAALLFAAVIGTHNITGLLVAPALLLWGLLAALLHARPRLMLRAAIVFGWGIALAALFWLPALWLSSQVRIDEMFGGWRDWTYMCDVERLWSRFREIGGQPLFRNLTFAPGDWQILAAIGALAITARARRRARGRPRARAAAHRRLVATVVPLAIFTVFAAGFTLLDHPLWARVPLVTTIQFPYRLLAVMTPMICLATAGIGLLFPRRAEGTWPWVLLLGLVATSASMYPGPQEKARFIVEGRERSVRSARVERLVATSYQTGNNLDEFLPRTVHRSSPLVGAMASPEPFAVPPESGDVRRVEDDSLRCIVTLSREADIRFPVFAFSGWRATIDGESVPVSVDPDGRISVACPAGEHTIALRFGLDTPSRLGLGITLVALLSAIPLLVRWRKRW
jgi:hypothetical protein